ncbi:MAG: HEAT repeat domain-containing protein [Candidatus Omnitrophota bacterium]
MKVIKVLIKLVLALVIVLILYEAGCYGYWWLRAWEGPDSVSKLEVDLRKEPSEILIKRLYNIDIFSPYPQMAMQILAERKEKKAVPELIKFTKSWNRYYRRTAIWSLGIINDPRAIRPLMEIVSKGESHSNYKDALMALSRMKYEGAFPYVKELAEREDATANGSIAMLREFAKPECIPLLENMRKKIKKNTPLAKFDKSRIDDAIKYIASY